MAVKNFLGVFGHVVLDHILAVPRLPVLDRTVRVLARDTYYGGTGGNIARIAARLGVPTALASFVGEDFPEEYRQALARDGVDVTDLRAIRGASTPSAWVFTAPGGKQTTVIDQGPMWDAHTRRLPTHTVHTAQVVHLATGRPRYHLRVARLAAKLGKTIALDPSQEITYAYTRESFLPLLRLARLFFGNETETRIALKFARLRQPKDLLRYVEQVIMTRGRKGSVVITREDGAHRIPRVPPRRIADVTGAGDAYRAGYYAGMSRGYEPRRCALLGSAVASFILERPGTQSAIPTWEDAVARARKFDGF